MSGRRRRSETIWDDKEEQRASAEIHSNISPGRSGYWSKSDAHDDSMRGNFSRSPSRNHLHGNRNEPRDDDIRRDRNRMYSHPTPDGWEKQYNTRPSDESYDLPYRFVFFTPVIMHSLIFYCWQFPPIYLLMVRLCFISN
ncbi:hypothetical protein Hanom_Chr06g00566241 [Helianthus anomalus]